LAQGHFLGVSLHYNSCCAFQCVLLYTGSDVIHIEKESARDQDVAIEGV